MDIMLMTLSDGKKIISQNKNDTQHCTHNMPNQKYDNSSLQLQMLGPFVVVL